MSSGKQSFMKALFCGVISSEHLLPYPEITGAEGETLRRLLGDLRELAAREIDSVAIDQEQAIPSELLSKLGTLGLLGTVVPERHGGLGLSRAADARLMEELGAIDASVAATVAAHVGIGLKGLLLFGTEAQRARYLPELASGRSLAAFALTEPGAGSDAAGITTRADLAEDGGGYQIDGSKLWVTNGDRASLFTVFARTSEPGLGQKPGITAFLVERSFGVQSGAPLQTMGVRGLASTSVELHRLRIPAGNLLGELGHGFGVAMEILNDGRLGLAARCVGGCKAILRLAARRANERRAFGRPIADFGLVKEKLARIAAETYALESMVYLTAGIAERGFLDHSLESAICKVFASETYWRAVDQAARIAGGIGYATSQPYERMIRDARVNLIFEGTNEILLAFIALAGMRHPAAQLTEVERAMREPVKGFGVLSDFALQRARAAFGRERLAGVHPVLAREAVLFEEGAAALARSADRVLRRHGREVAEMQLVQRRLAEVAIELYALACTLARTTRAIERSGVDSAAREIELSAAFATLAQARLEVRIEHMEREEDEVLKQVAARSCSDGGYDLDILG
ncbi:MAG: acyl-CoA dehydrogenase family protein [Myxococcales bacterium]|nr:acyl-CoA dehydrogenase family protein [Myxococcales bacterium]